MTMISQFQDSCFLFTFLGKPHPHTHTPTHLLTMTSSSLRPPTRSAQELSPLLFLHPFTQPYIRAAYSNRLLPTHPPCYYNTEDYRKNPTGATPWMCLTLYDEFLQDKQLGLLRGDVSYHLTREVNHPPTHPCTAPHLNRLFFLYPPTHPPKQEGQYLMNALLEHYTHSDKYKTLWQFNHEPKNFSFDKYIRGVKKPPKVEKPASSIIT